MLLIRFQTQMSGATMAIVSLISISTLVMGSPQNAGQSPPFDTRFEKIDPKVREQAKESGLISVFIMLARQPQAEIRQRVEARHAVRLAIAQERLQRATELTSTPEADLASAADARNAVLLDIRREAFAEIGEAIRGDQETMEARLLGMGAQNIHHYRLLNMIAVDIPPSAVDLLQQDEMVSEISLIERTGVAEAYPPNLAAIHVDAFWDNGPLNPAPGAPNVTGVGQTIALLDSGVSNLGAFDVGKPGGLNIQSHVVLEDAKAHDTACFADQGDSLDYIPNGGHGTEVASVLASRQSAYPGVAKGLTELLNLKVGYLSKTARNCTKGMSTADVYTAIEWALDGQNKVTNIFNLSHGWDTITEYDPLAQKIDKFIDDNRLAFVKSAGNGQWLTDPGSAYNVITVAAWDVAAAELDKRIPAWSGKRRANWRRKKPDIAAPGVNIGVANAPSGSSPKSGTSLAAPHVAAALALLAEFGITDPLLEKALLINSADRPEEPKWRSDRGWGYLNLQTLRQQASFQPGGKYWVTPDTTYDFFVGPGPQASAAALDATLTWNRHFSTYPAGFLNDLDLFAYTKDSGSPITKSESDVDNVEFVHVTQPGDVVLKVKHVNSWGDTKSEHFQLAFSLEDYHLAAGPVLSIICPDGLQDLTKPWTCTVKNTGDLPAFNITVTRNGGEMQKLGTIKGGTSLPAPWTIPAGGTQNMLVQSTSYDEQFTVPGTFHPRPDATTCFTIASTLYSVVINPPPGAPGCPPNVACQVVRGAGPFTGTFDVMTGPGCAWTAQAFPPTAFPGALSVAPASGAGNGTLTWTASAFNKPYSGDRMGKIMVTLDGLNVTPVLIGFDQFVFP